MAFVCWNRFLDLCEVIEEGQGGGGGGGMVDNSDFEGSDVPYDVE